MQQRGAIFGLDARLLVLTLAILGSITGYTLNQRIKADKIDYTQGVLMRAKAIAECAYQNNATATGAMAGGGWARCAGVTQLYDAWGNTLIEQVLTDTLDADLVDLPAQCIIYLSRGPNGVNNSVAILAATLDRNDLVRFNPTGDDLAVHTCFDQANQARFQASATTVAEAQQALTTFAQMQARLAQRTCRLSPVTPPTPSWCDYDANGTYEAGEEQQYNFFPYEQRDSAISGRYYDNVVNSRTFDGTDTNPLSSDGLGPLRRLLGLHASAATGCYDSNLGNRVATPWSAGFNVDCSDR